jgi:hypothetical protein
MGPHNVPPRDVLLNRARKVLRGDQPTTRPQGYRGSSRLCKRVKNHIPLSHSSIRMLNTSRPSLDSLKASPHVVSLPQTLHRACPESASR